MKNRELADLLFDKMAEYLERTPAGELLVRVSSAAGKSPRELLPAFVQVWNDSSGIVGASYLDQISGIAYDFRDEHDGPDSKKIFRTALASLDRPATVNENIVVSDFPIVSHGEEANGKAFLISDISLDMPDY